MIRYPGGKSKLKHQILSKFTPATIYVEPFFGGGSLGLLVKNFPQIWINDFDLGIASLWQSLIYYPEQFKQAVRDFVPSTDKFYEFKAELTQPKTLTNSTEIVEFGFKKLAIHQISYSGLGTKSGGPLGGKSQKSQYKIDCRWSPDYICKKIDKIHGQFSKIQVKITNLDFSEVVRNIETDAMIYLDPPYFVKGNELYQHGFTIKDHERLAACLKETNHHWVLSYDDCPEIRNLYNWANIEEIGVNYTINSLKNKVTGERTSRNKTELLIERK